MQRIEALSWLLAAGLGVLAIWQVVLLADTQSLLTPIVGLDFVPVYAGSRAVAAGLNPNDPNTIARILQEAGLGSFSSHNAYPASWGFLMMPWTGMPFEKLSFLWRDFLLLALVGAAPLLSFSATLRRHSWGWIGCSLILLLWSQMWVTRLSLDLGQTNLVLVLAVSAIVFLASRAWDRSAGAILALGAAAKLLPGVLLIVALLRCRWKLVGSAVCVGGLVLVGTWIKVPQWSIPGYLDLTSNLVAHSRYGTLDGVPAVPIEGIAAWIFSQRGPLLLIATLVPLLALRGLEPDRDLDVASFGFLLACFAANGAMSYTNYEAVLLLPVIGLVLTWPLTRDPLWMSLPTALVLLIVLFGTGVHQELERMNPYVWAPTALFVWVVSAQRFGWHVRRVMAGA